MTDIHADVSKFLKLINASLAQVVKDIGELEKENTKSDQTLKEFEKGSGKDDGYLDGLDEEYSQIKAEMKVIDDLTREYGAMQKQYEDLRDQEMYKLEKAMQRNKDLTTITSDIAVNTFIKHQGDIHGILKHLTLNSNSQHLTTLDERRRLDDAVCAEEMAIRAIDRELVEMKKDYSKKERKAYTTTNEQREESMEWMRNQSNDVTQNYVGALVRLRKVKKVD